MVGAAPQPESVGTEPPETSNAPWVLTETDIEDVNTWRRELGVLGVPTARPMTL
jgi:hypothetical protein